jgi:putative ABC transport system permease protein
VDAVIRISMRDLQFRSVRFLVTVMGTALIFSMVLILTGLSEQFTAEARRTVRSFGGDGWVVQSTALSPFTSATSVPEELGHDLLAAGAKQADPLILVARQVQKLRGRYQLIFAVGYQPGRLGTPPIRVGRAVRALGEAVISEESGVAIGEHLKVGGADLRVVGLTHRRTLWGSEPVVFMDLRDAQSVFFAGKPLASAILVRGPVKNLGKAYTTRTPKEVWEDALRALAMILSSLRILTLILWVASVVLMGSVVYLSALDRLRDFALFKALGGATSTVVAGLALQSVLIALVAGGVGVVLQKVLVPVFPIKFVVPLSAYVTLPLVTVSAGLAASLAGVNKAARVDPALAFASAG